MKTLALNLQKYISLRLNLVVYVLGYTIPFIFAGPQLVTGTIINALIFTASEKLEKKYIIPLLILPSLGAFTHGVLFGPLTIFLIYFLPFIWLGNFVMSEIFSLSRKLAYPLRVVTASFAKYILLVLAANIYFELHVVPQLFVTSMGVLQLATALLGGFLSYFIIKSLKHDRA